MWPEAQAPGGRVQYQHTPPFLLLWRLTFPPSPSRCSLEAWRPENIPRETPDSDQKLSVQEGLLGRKWIITIGLWGEKGIPHLGKASPPGAIFGEVRGGVLESRTSGKEGEGKGGPRFICTSRPYSLSHSFNKHLMGADSVTGTDAKGQGEDRATDTEAVCFFVQDSRLSPLPTLALNPFH